MKHRLAHALVRAAPLVMAVLALTGCERTFRNMYDQPRYKPLAASTVWPDGRASRPEVPGTVARAAGAIAGASSGRIADAGDDVAPAAPQAGERPTLALLQRGRERFDVFCAPCHSIAGDGDGMIVRRGFPAPPSFHSERLRTAPDAHFEDVITHGYGAMYPYANRVPPADRHAIVAYIRALQRAQHAALDDVPAAERQRLAEQR